ncbi:MAG: mannonate dehydratase [Kiritimatiellae bacterium]|nr:mannonate dehydratase [Kiritimatiellia bacterium]
MTLVEFVPPTPHPLWELCPQMGITDVVVKVNPELTGLANPWRYETLSSIVSRLKSAGLNVVGLEGDPFDMTPIKEYSSAHSAALREESLSHYRELLESMGKLGIKLLCYNFMVGKGWSRTGVREGRGGAKATYFSLKELTPKESDGSANASPFQNVGALAKTSDKSELKISHDQVWANYEYFIKAVMPTAEKCGVRMALHPDDPCLPSLGGYARIFGSIEAYDRAYAIYPSPSNAVTFCQANFKLMFTNGNCHNCSQILNTNFSAHSASLRLCVKNNPVNPVNPVQTLADAARHFGKRIAFIHIRDVEGTKEDFTELFHDQGDTDQFALMRTYHELGLDVPVRGDHVPEMAYDRVLTPDGTPGYFTLGRLFANGYLKALLRGSE